jgi:D-glycero-beta-D-manno-heptose 1-phosphate adenylyltransferase
MRSNRKILTIEEIMTNIVATDKVILAGGCFDILHIGHIEYLYGAKELGNKLIVGVNSDESIINIKNHIPTMNAYDRSIIIASLECVDYVFIFAEDTLDKSLTMIKPTIYAKGIDYLHKKVPESETARQLGVHIKLIGDTKKTSSSQIKNLILE